MSSLPFRRPVRSTRHAFTLIELLTVIAIIAVLATLGVSVVSSVQAKGRSTKCANFMRQLGSAALLYANDHDMTLPATVHQRKDRIKSWTITLQEYANGTVTFRCPDDENKTRPHTYVINDFLTPNPVGAPDINYSRLANLERPSQTFLFAEAKDTYTEDHFHFTYFRGSRVPEAEFASQVGVKRHQQGANYVFADGHMETVGWDQVKEFLQQQERRFVDPTYEP